MRVAVAGLPFEIVPDERLSAAELASLDRVDAASVGSHIDTRPFVLDLVDDHQRMNPTGGPAAAGPAEVITSGHEVRLRHRDFAARFDMELNRGILTRTTRLGYPIEITLRTAMCCRLPLVGGVALHAAGLVVDGRGAVFFGPSGAGKTTITRKAPYPAMSDELVAVHGKPWRLRATGFWGELTEQYPLQTAAPLAGLFALNKGLDLEITLLDPMDAFRRLLSVVVLPDAPDLWKNATAVLAELVGQVPSRAIAWSPHQSPWPALARALDSTAGENEPAGHEIEGDRHVA